MASVTFLTTVGGDGSTVTDDSNATTGLGNGGHRLRFIPCLTNLVNIADNTVTQATNAASSASSASSSASLASTSATNANNSFLSIDTKYLGAKTGDPALNNQGGALTTGATYWNSSTNTMRIYNGTGWENTSALTDFASNTFRVSDNSDSTKKVAFNISGITAGTVRTLTVPNASGTIALLESPTFTGTVGGITKSMVGLGNVDNTSDATKFTNPSVTGNLTFGSSAARILGDFSTGTYTNRLSFQTSTVNGNTIIQSIPNGTGTLSAWNLHNGIDFNNSGFLQIGCDTTNTYLTSTARGTGTNLPLNIYVGGSNRLSIATSGAITMDTSLSVPTITTTGSTGLTLTNATSNNIFFYGNGANAPTFTTRSAGTKIVLWPSLSGTAVDNAIGVGLDGPWFSTANTSSVFKWYGGTTLAATLTGTGDFTTTGTVSGSSATGFRNKIINGDFQIWQGGTTFTTDAVGTIIYTADQIYAQALFPGNGATQTVTKEMSIVPSGATACLKSVVSTAVPANYSRMLLGLTFEDKESQKLAGKVVTVSMQVRGIGNIDKIQLVSLYSTSGGKATYGATQIALTTSTINTSAFTRATLTFTVPSAATLTASGTLGLYFIYYKSSGTVESVGDGIYLGDIMLEEGSVATPFERRPYGLELSLCQRYYEVSGTNTYLTIENGQAFAPFTAGIANVVSYKFATPKRVPPTCRVWRANSANTGLVLSSSSTVTSIASTINDLRFNAGSVGASGQTFIEFAFDASARL
jgi:hypothetical protein